MRGKCVFFPSLYFVGKSYNALHFRTEGLCAERNGGNFFCVTCKKNRIVDLGGSSLLKRPI